LPEKRLIDKNSRESAAWPDGPVVDSYVRGSVVKSRLKQAPPPNSLRYYRNLAGRTLMEIAAALNTKHQTIGKLETRQTILTPEWADRIGSLIGVPAQLIGFSYAPDAYIWAAKAVPVIGTVNADMRIEAAEPPYCSVGIWQRPVPASTFAVTIGREAFSQLSGYLLLFDDTKRERVTPAVISRQNQQDKKFIVHLIDGSMWWRRIVPGAKRNRYHLESVHKSLIENVEIESVSEIFAIEAPGLQLPPPDAFTE
jgi:hypothetical protein